MVDEGTLATSAQVLLAIGENATAAQVLEANTNIWIKMAESDMEKEFDGIGLVTNYATITASYKQWLAKIAVAGASIEGINQDPNSWGLATTQTKLNVHTTTWEKGLKDLTDEDVIARLGL